MNVQRGKIVSGGRVIVPAEFRRALGLKDGDAVIIELDGDGLRVRSYQAVIAAVQQRMKNYAPADGSFLSDELIADRRAEAGRE